MIALVTGNPTIKVQDGERLLVAFPSGDGELVASLTLNQCLYLMKRTQMAVSEAFALPEPVSATVLPFRREA